MAQLILPQLSYDIQGACFDVHNQLKHFDLSEEGWEKALAIALHSRNITAHRQVEFALHYKNRRVGRFFVDTIAEREARVLLELKKVPLEPIHRAKVITYLRITGLELGILISFGGDRVVYERIPNRIEARPGLASNPEMPASLHMLDRRLAEELWLIFCEVRRELGPGLMHMHYRRACQVEMRLRHAPYEKINEIPIHYRGQPIDRRKLPMLVVENRLLVAPLAVLQATPKVESRYRACLEILGLRQGLIVNFRPETPEVVVLAV
jgi:GxxExxY protein